jgi:hypothetical protein
MEGLRLVAAVTTSFMRYERFRVIESKCGAPDGGYKWV